MPTERALRLASIPEPTSTIPGLHATAYALKNNIDVLTGAIGPKEQRAVTFVDLVNMGLITMDQIPPKHGDAPSGKVLDGY